MALIDELKQRRETATRTLAQIEQRIADEKNSVARVTEGIADLDRAIAALEAPAQPLDELRSVPGAEEEVRDQIVTFTDTQEFAPDVVIYHDKPAPAAPLIDAQTCEEVDPRCSWKAEAPASEQDASVKIEPSPYAEAVEKGAITQDEADFLVSERERIAADEQAKFFAQGMMADADRHQSDQRGIVGTIASIFKREREDA